MFTSPKSVTPPVNINAHKQRGKEVWLVKFSPRRNNIPRGKFSRRLYNLCKKINQQYSQTHRGCRWPSEEMGKEKLRQNLLGKNTSEKSEINESQCPTPVYVISDNDMEKIRKMGMEIWIWQKRYSESTLRHSYLRAVLKYYGRHGATHLTNQGVNIQNLLEMPGHNPHISTMIYTHLSGKEIRKCKVE